MAIKKSSGKKRKRAETMERPVVEGRDANWRRKVSVREGEREGIEKGN